MSDKIVEVLISFVLLTVVGGILGAILQHRSWTYKWSLESKDKRLSIARDVYQEVSRLMDKRLFRSKQLHIWLRRNNSERIEFSVSNYRSIIFEWNESINRNLAMLEIYFGKEIRSSFDFGVGRMFVEAGKKIELELYSDRDNRDINWEQVDEDLFQLHVAVCDFNLLMLNEIEKSSEASFPDLGIIRDIKVLLGLTEGLTREKTRKLSKPSTKLNGERPS